MRHPWRMFGLALSAILVLTALSGCGQGSKGPNPSAENPAQNQTPPQPDGPTPPPAQPPAPPPATLRPLAGIQFIDAKIGWAVGNGHVLGTTDGGKTWTESRRDSANYTAVDFVNAGYGWVLGPDVFLRTTDAGFSWMPASPPTGSVPKAIHFTSPTHGWATDGTALYEATPNWRKVATPGPVQSFCFANDSLGWAAGSKVVYQTKDGGQSWQASTTAPLQNENWTSELKCSGNTAWVLYRGGGAMSQEAYIVYRTLDAGATWQPVLKEGYFDSVYPTAGDVKEQIDAYSGPFQVISAQEAVFLGRCPACGGGKVSLTTTRDGGTSFTHTAIPALEGAGSMGLWFTDADHGWIAAGLNRPNNDSVGIILSTSDGGKTWTQVTEYKPWQR